jgi:hypothetical protein
VKITDEMSAAMSSAFWDRQESTDPWQLVLSAVAPLIRAQAAAEIEVWKREAEELNKARCSLIETKKQLLQQLKTVRAQALEEAAKVASTWGETWIFDPKGRLRFSAYDVQFYIKSTGRAIHEDIRALIEPHSETGESK